MDQIHKRGMGDEQLNIVISIPRSCHLDRKSSAKSCTQAIGWGHLQEEFPGRITEDCHSHQGSGSLGTMWTVWMIYRAELPAEMLMLINYLCCKCKFRKDPRTRKSINTWSSGTVISEKNLMLSYMHSMASTVGPQWLNIGNLIWHIEKRLEKLRQNLNGGSEYCIYEQRNKIQKVSFTNWENVKSLLSIFFHVFRIPCLVLQCFFYYQEKWSKLKSWQTEENDVKREEIASLELYKNVRGSFHGRWSLPCLSSGGRW